MERRAISDSGLSEGMRPLWASARRLGIFTSDDEGKGANLENKKTGRRSPSLPLAGFTSQLSTLSSQLSPKLVPASTKGRILPYIGYERSDPISMNSRSDPCLLSPMARLILSGLLALATSPLSAAIPGDRFVEPLDLTGSHWEGIVWNAGGTREPGEKPHFPEVPTIRSIWMRWTAPASGPVYVSATPSNAPTHLFSAPIRQPWGVAAYLASNSVTNLVAVGRPLGGHGFPVTTAFSAEAGQTYLLAFDNEYPRDAEGRTNTFQILLHQSDGTPAHDALANAAPLSLGEEPQYSELRGASLEPGEPSWGTWDWWYGVSLPNPGGGMGVNEFVDRMTRGGNSLWYRWRAPAGGGVAAEFFMPGSFPQCAVYEVTGDENSALTFDRLREVARKVNGQMTEAGPNGRREFSGSSVVVVPFRAQAGREYVVRVDQITAERVWDGQPIVNWVTPHYDSYGWIQLRAAPANDEFAAALALSPATLVIARESFTTAETGEPAHGGQPARASLWYRGEVPLNGLASLEFQGPAGSRLAIYRGESLNQLTLLAQEEFPTNLSGLGRASFRLSDYGPGPLRIAVEPSPHSAIPSQLQWDQGNTQDAPEQAPLLTRNSFALSTLGATGETAQDRWLGPERGTVWVRWLAPAAGHYQLRTTNQSLWRLDTTASVTVFDRASNGEWTPVAHALPRLYWPVGYAHFTSPDRREFLLRVATEPGLPGLVQLDLATYANPLPAIFYTLRPSPRNEPGWFILDGEPERLVDLESSADLTRWEPWGSAQIGDRGSELRMFDSPSASQRFFRARLP